MAPASVQVVCMEPVVFLRGQSASGEDARGRRRQIDFDAPPSQLRGLVTLTLPRPSRIKEISITLVGKARTDWPEGIGPNRLETVEESLIIKQKVTLYSAREQAPTRRPRASSIGPGIECSGVDDLSWPSSSSSPSASASTRNGQGATHPSASPQPSSSLSPSSSFAAALGLSEGRKSPKISRSLGKTAAKVLPIVNNRHQHPNSTNPSFRPSSSPAPSLSPARSPLSAVSSGSNNPNESYFDPPPGYDNAGSSSGGGNVSASAVTPSASHHSTRHPQSVSAAGPSQRSILHSSTTGEQRARLRGTESPVGVPHSPVVRFDPEAVSNALQRQVAHPSNGAERSAPDSAQAQEAATTSNRFYRSEPNSRRASVDNTLSRQATGSSSTNESPNNSKGKGKANANTASPVPPIIPVAARRGIKNLLGGLRKDEEPETKASRYSTGQSNDMNLSTSSGAAHDDQMDWREFPKGTHTYPFSIPLPSNLPPTLHVDFGSNAYTIRAHVHRAGPLTANLSSETEVTLVHAPDEGGQDDIDTIVVERNWEDALRYMIVVMGKSFPVGGRIPVWIKFVPTEKIRIHRIIATLEERTAYYAKGRRVARHEVPRRWTLLKVMPVTASTSGNTMSNADKKILQQGILPILSDDPNALLSSPLAPMARAAALSYSDITVDETQRDLVEATALASLADPTGPWELTMELEIPKGSTTRINISSNHLKSNISVHHIVKLAIRVERLDGYNGVDPQSLSDDKRKLYDILIEAPISINHSHTANAWLTLPDYWSVPSVDDTAEQQTGTGSLAAFGNGASQQSGSQVAGSSSGASLVRTLSAEANRRSRNAAALPSRLVQGIAGSSSVAEGAGSSSHAASSHGNGVQPAYAKDGQQVDSRNAKLAQISRKWLSLTGAAFGNAGANASSASPTPQSYQTTVAFAGHYGQDLTANDGQQSGLPTYDMIDREGGSIDPPPSQRPRQRIK